MGQRGEQIAADFLRKKGFKILEQNWGNKWGEIDLIGLQGSCYVFVEVKTKIGGQFGLPEEMINGRKLTQIQRMGQVYLRGREEFCRVDVVAVVLGAGGEILRVTHYENVY